MSWLDIHTSLYKCQADNTGRAATFREILLTEFAVPHEWYYKDNHTGKWLSGVDDDLESIIALRKMDRTAENYKSQKVLMKSTLQCFTPAALLETKKQGMVKEISRTGIMQLDFDYNDIKEYEVEELKRCVFNLPFIGFCGLSCRAGAAT